MTLTGFAVCAHTFVRINLSRKIIRCYSPTRNSYGVLAANKNELAGRAFGRVLAASWLSARLRWAAALVGRWRRCRCCQGAKRTGAGVS